MQIEELVEAAARRMAVADGQNPDKLSHNSFEWWRHYVPMARAAIEATLSAAEPVVYVSRKSLEQLNAEGSHVAVQTLIHRVPLRSGNGVPLFAGPLETTPSVAVKALEWRSGSTQHRQVASVFDRPMYEAGIDNGRWYWLHNWNGLALRRVDSENEAKAAAQADYEARIISALSAQGQETNCAKCGMKKHTPLRVDRMGGYVCLTCIDTALSAQVQDAAAKSLADAYQKYLDASDLYNERLAISKTKALGTMRVDEEYRAIDEARRAFDKLAVDIAKSALPAAPAKQEG